MRLMSQQEKASVGLGNSPRQRGLRGVWGNRSPHGSLGAVGVVGGGRVQRGLLRTCLSLLDFLSTQFPGTPWTSCEKRPLGHSEHREYIQGSDKSCRKESWMTLQRFFGGRGKGSQCRSSLPSGPLTMLRGSSVDSA